MKKRENMETKNENQFQKMSRIASIASVALVIMLIAGIILSNKTGLNQIKKSMNVELGTKTELTLSAKEFFRVEDEVAEKIKFDTSEVDLTKIGEYKAVAKYNGKEYTIKVIVEDTTAPKATMESRILFTNDIAAQTDFKALVKEVKDAQEVTTKLVRFEKKKDLLEINELEIKNLTEGAKSFVKAEDALAVGEEEVPTKPAVYRSVLEIADASGNASYEEVVVVLDPTGAMITDVADQTVTVTKDKLNEQPEVDKTLYSATDNVDGYIKGEELTYEVTCRDEAKHEWIVKVTYTDRAGNESSGEFLITVKEQNGNTSNGGNNSNTGNTNTGNTSNGGNASNGGGNSSSSDNTSNGGYHPADKDKDGTVSTDEEMEYITPEKQTLINAGYGVVCEFDGGTWYGILMKSNEHTINGKLGREILREYLHEHGLEGDIGGSWISTENEWYWYRATNIHEKPKEYDDDFWDSVLEGDD